MLVNENILFIHIPKNAGSSIEKYFETNYGYFEYSNKLINSLKKYSYLTSYSYLYFPFFINFFKPIIDNYHPILPKYDKYENMKIFTIVRHPQDRIVSFYIYFGFNNYLSFYKFLILITMSDDYLSNFIKRNQVEYINLEKVDILKYENIEEDWKSLCKKYEIDYVKLDVVNKSNCVDKNQYFDDKCIKLIYDLYKTDFDILKYKIKKKC